MFEFLILFSVSAGLVRLAWIMRAERRALDLANQAWRVALDDQYYVDRRHLEERKRVVDEARRAHRRQAQIVCHHP